MSKTTIPTGGIADDAVNLTSKVTGTLPVANGGTALSSGFNNGATTEVDQWRVSAEFNGTASPIASNWERSDTTGYGKHGTGLTESSGIFTFPSTGIYIIYAQMSVQFNEEDTDSIMSIATTTNNSSYTAQSTCREADKNTDGRKHAMSCMAVFDVTNVTTHKFRIDAQSVASSNTVGASSGETITGFTVFRIGDT